jgi:AI-2 transport protein TqsA
LGAVLAIPLTLLTKALLLDVDPSTQWMSSLVTGGPAPPEDDTPPQDTPPEDADAESSLPPRPEAESPSVRATLLGEGQTTTAGPSGRLT